MKYKVDLQLANPAFAKAAHQNTAVSLEIVLTLSEVLNHLKMISSLIPSRNDEIGF